MYTRRTIKNHKCLTQQIYHHETDFGKTDKNRVGHVYLLNISLHFIL